MKIFKMTLLSLLLLFITSLNAGWDASSEAQKAQQRAQQINEAQVALSQFKNTNGKLKVFFLTKHMDMLFSPMLVRRVF